MHAAIHYKNKDDLKNMLLKEGQIETEKENEKFLVIPAQGNSYISCFARMPKYIENNKEE